MRLSEAIRAGTTLRPENHTDRFVETVGRGLTSDAYGAACEAVSPQVAKLNWNHRDRIKFESAMNTVRAVQDRYFGHYRTMPAVCPGSQQRYLRAGGRIVANGLSDHPKIAINEGSVEAGNLGGVTSECDKVEHMFGMVDHLFYAHGWSREEVAQAVEAYETTRSNASLIRNFAHYAVN